MWEGYSNFESFEASGCIGPTIAFVGRVDVYAEATVPNIGRIEWVLVHFKTDSSYSVVVLNSVCVRIRWLPNSKCKEPLPSIDKRQRTTRKMVVNGDGRTLFYIPAEENTFTAVDMVARRSIIGERSNEKKSSNLCIVEYPWKTHTDPWNE